MLWSGQLGGMTDLFGALADAPLLGSVLGWFGTAGTFTAYVLIWRGWVPPTAKRYASLNAVGGMLAATGALAYGAWPAVASNVVWALIGVHGLVEAGRRRGSAARNEQGVPHSHGAHAALEDVHPAQPLTPEERAIFEAITQPLPIISPEALAQRQLDHSLTDGVPLKHLPAPVPAVRG